MGTLFVARNTAFGRWAADVGLGKHVFKAGYSDAPLKPLLAEGWCGEPNWTALASEPAEVADEAALIAGLSGRLKMVDPTLYPRLKGTTGIFRVQPVQVENHRVLVQALEEPEGGDPANTKMPETKLKPVDFAAFLLHMLRREVARQ